jgi:hypothetical protein
VRHQESVEQGGGGGGSPKWQRGGEAGGGSVAAMVPVGNGTPVISGGSGDALQQGGAMGEVRGELNRTGRLRRWRSPGRRCQW